MAVILRYKGRLACRLMLNPLANPSGTGGRRPAALRIVWAALRNVRLLFVVSKISGAKAEEAEKAVAATSQIATAIVEVDIPGPFSRNQKPY